MLADSILFGESSGVPWLRVYFYPDIGAVGSIVIALHSLFPPFHGKKDMVAGSIWCIHPGVSSVDFLYILVFSMVVVNICKDRVL